MAADPALERTFADVKGFATALADRGAGPAEIDAALKAALPAVNALIRARREEERARRQLRTLIEATEPKGAWRP